MILQLKEYNRFKYLYKLKYPYNSSIFSFYDISLHHWNEI